jgi:ATP-dependent DNA helicase RecG
MSENQHIEYKQSWHDDYLKWICGFANASGGVLFVGRKDNGELIDVEDHQRLMESIPNKIRDLMGILCEVILHELDAIHFIKIKVPAYSVPVSLRGRYYMRSGATNLELTGVELNEFLLKKAGKSWDDVVEENASLADIDEASISKFISDSKEKGRMPDTAGMTISQILDKLHLTIDGKLKRAALILFGKDPSRFFPNIQVKIGRFGADATDLKFHEIIEGNLVHLLHEVPVQLNYKFLTRPIKFEGLQREEKDIYPAQAIREMLLNALVHRTYMGAPVQMRVFDKQLSIWNEGTLPIGLSIEDLKTDHNSRPRNPIIANACFLAGYIDSWGRGTLKIINACREYGLPEPAIIEKNGGIQVTMLESNEVSNQVGNEGLVKGLVKELVKGLVKDLTENQVKLLEFIEAHPNVTKEEMAKHVGISTTAIDNNIKTLKQKGLLERKGGRKEGYWKIINPEY